jgi:hypothetical protein
MIFYSEAQYPIRRMNLDKDLTNQDLGLIDEVESECD